MVGREGEGKEKDNSRPQEVRSPGVNIWRVRPILHGAGKQISCFDLQTDASQVMQNNGRF